MIQKFVLPLAAALGLSALFGATPVHAADTTVKIRPDAEPFVVKWFGSPDQIHIVWRLLDMDGKIGICGAYALKGHSMSATSRTSLKEFTVTMDGKEILKSIDFFTRYDTPAALPGATAACHSTGYPVAGNRKRDFLLSPSQKRYRM
ncbi:MAG: hypothetical protein JXJ18_02085 [Rhodobacteraceae bacterium]|nr:hypothetical protein [Paracoccaceae bacterium]